MSRFYDINEAFIQALQEQELEEARSHKEDNEKASPRDDISANGLVAKNKYNSNYWDSANVKRNRISSKERVAKSLQDLRTKDNLTDTEYKSLLKKSNDMRYEPTEYDLNKDSREYKDLKRVANAYRNGNSFTLQDNDRAKEYDDKAKEIISNRQAKSNKKEARSHKEDNEKVAPRNRTQSFNGGPNKLSNKASGIAIGDKDRIKTGTSKVGLKGNDYDSIISRDIKRNRVRSAEQALNRKNVGQFNFGGTTDIQDYEVSPNQKSREYRSKHNMITRENKKVESDNQMEIDEQGLPVLENPYYMSKANNKLYIQSSHPYDLTDYAWAVNSSADINGKWDVYDPNPEYSIYMDIDKRPQQNLFRGTVQGWNNALNLIKDLDKNKKAKIDRT